MNKGHLILRLLFGSLVFVVGLIFYLQGDTRDGIVVMITGALVLGLSIGIFLWKGRQVTE